MKFSQSDADVFVPEEDMSAEAAMSRTTHLCVAAHQDDIEIMAYPAIAECFDSADKWFSGVVVTNGAGSPRSGPYAQYTDEQMQRVRRLEQRKAASVGKYSIQLQLNHSSSTVKTPENFAVQSDLVAIFTAAGAEHVYLHQPSDKHDTHVGVLGHCLRALRMLPPELRPKKVYGCEVWRDLDWMLDEDKQCLDASLYPDLSDALLRVFDSQISGGKRYDLAVAGRRLANATFHVSHETDACSALTWAMDLTPLVDNPGLDLAAFTLAHIDRMRNDVASRLSRFT